MCLAFILNKGVVVFKAWQCIEIYTLVEIADLLINVVRVPSMIELLRGVVVIKLFLREDS